MHPRQPRPVLFVAIALVAALTLVASCRSKDCVPGQQVACACPGATQGVQACDIDGSRYLPCICTTPQSVGTTTAAPIAARVRKQIRCGPLTCDVACCATFDPPTCTQDPRECARTEQGDAVIYECDGPEDCGAGKACCLVPGKTVIGAVCVPRSECTGTFQHPRFGKSVAAKKICHANVDCEVSEMCGPSGDSTGILTCNK